MSFIHRAICTISGSLKPREVTAGVPTRMPLVTKGFSGSLGMAFLLTVICCIDITDIVCCCIECGVGGSKPGCRDM